MSFYTFVIIETVVLILLGWTLAAYRHVRAAAPPPMVLSGKNGHDPAVDVVEEEV